MTTTVAPSAEIKLSPHEKPGRVLAISHEDGSTAQHFREARVRIEDAGREVVALDVPKAFARKPIRLQGECPRRVA